MYITLEKRFKLFQLSERINYNIECVAKSVKKHNCLSLAKSANLIFVAIVLNLNIWNTITNFVELFANNVKRCNLKNIVPIASNTYV